MMLVRFTHLDHHHSAGQAVDEKVAYASQAEYTAELSVIVYTYSYLNKNTTV
jgi:hypothetical protein